MGVFEEHNPQKIQIEIVGPIADRIVGLLQGNSQALNQVLIGQQAILTAIATLSGADPAKIAELTAILKASSDALAAAVAANQPATT